MFDVAEIRNPVFNTAFVGRVSNSFFNDVRLYRWAELAARFNTIGLPPLKPALAGCEMVTTAG